MPSVTKSRSSKSPVKASLKSSKLKKVGKAAAGKNGHNGHGNGVRLGAKTVVKGAAAKQAAAKTTKAGKRVYFFGGGKAEGNKEMKNLLGGKGANLAEMANIGLPVPPGFTITTDVCTEFYANGKKLPKQLDADVRAMVARMEKLVGAKFGDP
jgi:pyruvate, orthophosphate dikinase